MKEALNAVRAESQQVVHPKLPLYTCTRAMSARLNVRNDTAVVNPVNPGLRLNGNGSSPAPRVVAESKWAAAESSTRVM